MLALLVTLLARTALAADDAPLPMDFRSADGNYQLKLAGYVQPELRMFLGENPYSTNEFIIRRARIGFEGTLYQHVDARILIDAGGSKFTLFDAYVEGRVSPALKLRIGKFKSPLGLERLQKEATTTFIELSLVTNLMPSRDLGVQLSGDLFDGKLSYALGLFDGVPGGANVENDGDDLKEGAARVFFQPLKGAEGWRALSGLGFGVAGTYGVRRGTAANPELSSYKSSGQATTFSYAAASGTRSAAVANGAHWLVTPQLYWSVGPVGLMVELAWDSQEVGRDETQARVGTRAWQASASWVVTGGKASYSGVVTREPLNFEAGTWGELEVAARYESLAVDAVAFDAGLASASSVRAMDGFLVGVCWYPNRWLRVLLDFVHTRYTTVLQPRPAESALLSRVQLTF